MGQRTDTRQRIVHAALDLVREKGLRSFGMTEDRAARVATLIVTAMEGALVIARLEQTRDSFVDVREEPRMLVR